MPPVFCLDHRRWLRVPYTVWPVATIMAGRDYHHEATCRIESLPENPGVRTILILLFVFTSISSADEPKSNFLKTIDLNAHHDRQVIVDREAGQYLGHPTTCLLEDGQTMLCVYPKG